MDLAVWQCTRLPLERPLGGVEMHIKQMSIALQELGVEVGVGAAPPSSLLVKANKKIIVHSHGDVWPTFLLGSRMLYVPFFHGTTWGRMRACGEYLSPAGWKASCKEFFIARRADAAICVSEAAREEARKYYFLAKRAAVIPNGVDSGVFAPLSSISSRPRLLFIGRGSDRVKNLPRILSASERIWEKYPQFELLLVPGDEQARPFASSLGPKNSAELAELFKSVRGLILGSLYEADPIVVREAQAAGLPVLASDIPQLRSAMPGYENAFYFDPRRPDDIASKIEEAMFKKQMAPAPRQRTWRTAASELLGFYNSLGA